VLPAAHAESTHTSSSRGMRGGRMYGTVRGMKGSALLLLLPLLAACSNAAPFSNTIGILRPGSTLTVRVTDATLAAYQPAAGEARDRFTVAATAARGVPPVVPRIRPAHRGVLVAAPGKLMSLLVRVPDGVTLVVDSQRGDVNVTNVNGPVRVSAAQGDVRIVLRQSFAQTTVGQGNVTVTMGATQWPGTLHVSTQRGDISLSVVQTAAFAVRLHTGDGTLFTDFDLRGTSHGTSETIDGVVNGGSGQRIVVDTGKGSIQLLRLQAQP
jgi:Putative adhesin